MPRTIVVAFSTLDGIIEDPDGSQGTPTGGWMFRHGLEAVTGDAFGLGPALDTGVLVLGRVTWQAFSQLWPSRTDPFSTAMNRIPKLVVTHTAPDVSAWTNSTVLDGELTAAIAREKTDRDVIVMGSASVVHALGAAGLIDEYRIMLFPTVAGCGLRLFPDGAVPAQFHLMSATAVGQPVSLRYEQVTVSAAG